MWKKSLEAYLTVYLGLVFLWTALWGCKPRVQEEMYPLSFHMAPITHDEIPKVEDDMELDSLEIAAKRSLDFLRGLDPRMELPYGPVRVKVGDSIETISRVLELLRWCRNPKCLGEYLREEFLWLKAAGGKESPGKVLVTGYFLPRLEGRLEPGGEYKFPLYRLPDDLVEVDLGLFAKDLEGRKIVGRVEAGKLVPYYTRSEIERDMRLQGKGLEIVWVKDPIDRFFLHIQGSGEIVLEDGSSFILGYAGSNGHPYRSLGKVLLEKGAIPRDELSMGAIRAYLMDHQHEVDSLFWQNPSYVFFKRTDGGPLGHIGVPLTEGRSIATDKNVFPPGALAVLCGTLPERGAKGKKGPRRPFCRVVLNQDTGGAIKGTGRVDLYCGSGPEGEFLAGNLQDEGSLYFLVKKGLVSIDE